MKIKLIKKIQFFSFILITTCSIFADESRSILGNLQSQPTNSASNIPSQESSQNTLTLPNLPKSQDTINAQDALSFKPEHLSIKTPTFQETKAESTLPSVKKEGSSPQEKTNAPLLKEIKKDQIIRFYFEDATLENLVRYIEKLFDILFNNSK